MNRATTLFLTALLAGCANAPETGTQDVSTAPVQSVPASAGDLIIVADTVAWPSKLWFCPISADGAFEVECNRSLRLPREPGSDSSLAGELFSFNSGPETVGERKNVFNRVFGEQFAVHPSAAPASGRYALVSATDPGGTFGGRSIGIRTATYVFEARPNLVAILPASVPPGSNASDYRAREKSKVEVLVPKPGFSYEAMDRVRIECDRTGIIYGGDGKERCRIVP